MSAFSSPEMLSLRTSALERFIAGIAAYGPSVEVFGLCFDSRQGALVGLESALDDEERRELSRFPDERRRHMEASRGFLRRLIGLYSGLPAHSVPLKRDGWGRPHVPPVAGRGRLHVSCSRSGSLAVFAISTTGPVGVDVESLDAGRLQESIAEIFLSEWERGLMARVPAVDRARWLGRAWTSKEALLKAFGCGLQVDPRSADTSPEPEAPPSTSDAWQWRSPKGLGDWSVCDAEWAGASLAVATPQREARLQFVELQWDG